MLTFHTLAEFSRTHCIAICAFLVPLNLVATLTTLILTGVRRSHSQVWSAATIASLPAVLMILHVYTWFIVGVVRVPTYVLLTLGATCLTINFWAVVHPQSMSQLLRNLWSWVGGDRLRANWARSR